MPACWPSESTPAIYSARSLPRALRAERHNYTKQIIFMAIIKHNPAGVFPPYRCYSHAVEVQGNSRLLVISGLNGFMNDGKTMPESFEAQAELIWQHMGTILRAADMDYKNLISLRTYLADPAYDEAN